MKKRIISMILVIATVVTMLPVTLISAFAETTYGYSDGYNVYVTDEDPLLDGKLDAVYANSEKIISEHIATVGVSFEAYSLVTSRGLYLFANVADTTVETDNSSLDVKAADKLQFYLQLKNTGAGAEQWAAGYFEMDYCHSTVSATSAFSNTTRKIASTITAGKGYTIEFFMEWERCFDGQTVTPETIDLFMGIQVNNSQREVTSGNSESGLAYDNHCTSFWSGSYSSGNNKPTSEMISTNFTYCSTLGYLDGYDTIVTIPKAMEIDGNCDDVYLIGEKIVPNFYDGYNNEVDFYAYTAATEEGIYIWADIDDSSASTLKTGDKFVIDLEFKVGDISKTGSFDIFADKSFDLSGVFTEDGIETAAVKTDNGWSVEFYMPWNNAGIDEQYNSHMNRLSAYVRLSAHNRVDENSKYFAEAYSTASKAGELVKMNLLFDGSRELDSKGANFPGFSVYSHSETITVDAIQDEVYRKSQKINGQNMSNGAVVATNTDFEAYISDTASGMYIYATIEDNSIATANDKIEFHFTDSNKKVYNVMLTRGGTLTGVNVTVENCSKAVKEIKNVYGRSIGWVAEIYVPWTEDNCSVGIAVRNGSEASYSNYARNAWPTAADGSAANTATAYYVPLAYTNSAPASTNVYVTEEKILLDGTLDEVYKNSSKLWNRKNKYSYGDYVEFTAYYVVTLDGLYVWVDVEDTTMNNIHDLNAESGDMVQLYLDFTPSYYSHEINGKTQSSYTEYNKFYGGWYCFDYNGNISPKHPIKDLLPQVEMVCEKHIKSTWNGGSEPIINEANQFDGYTIEAFIPWTDTIKDQLGAHAKDIHVGVGIQVSDDTSYNYNKNAIWKGNKIVVKTINDGKEVEKTYLANDKNEYVDENGVVVDENNRVEYNQGKHSYGNDYRTNVSYDTSSGGNYYSSFEKLPNLNFIYSDELPIYNRYQANKVDTGATVDGVNTNDEYKNATIVHVNYEGSGDWDEGDLYRVLVTDDALYVLLEMVDDTPYHMSDYNKLEKCDYSELGVNFGARFTTLLRFYRTKTNDDPSCATNPQVIDTGKRWYNYTAVENGFKVACNVTDTYWSYEIKIPFTEEDKARIAEGTFDLGLCAQYVDSYDPPNEKRNYKYSAPSTGVYTGDDNVVSEILKFNYFQLGNDTLIKYNPYVTGAQVILGQSICIEYKATVPEVDKYGDNVYMKFTFNNKETVVKGVRDGNTTQYNFLFENVPPQCIIDNIKAELYVNNIKVDTDAAVKLEYSIYESLNNVKNDTTKALVEALLHYSAAAQKYVNYKTGKLANKGLTAPTYDDYDEYISNNNDRAVGTANIDGAKFSAVGVHHSNVNKIYVRVTVDPGKVNVENLRVTFTVNGVTKEAKLEEYSENVYILYTDGIYVTDFDEVYTFTLSNGNASQTLSYSINAYAKAKWNASSATTKELARALYAYGLAAEAYNNK